MVLSISIARLPLRRTSFENKSSHPDLAFLLCQQDNRHGFGWIGSTTAFDMEFWLQAESEISRHNQE
jgi:hypothetical protein